MRSVFYLALENSGVTWIRKLLSDSVITVIMFCSYVVSVLVSVLK